MHVCVQKSDEQSVSVQTGCGTTFWQFVYQKYKNIIHKKYTQMLNKLS